MNRRFLSYSLLCVFVSLFLVVQSVFAESFDARVVIMPGVFYFTVSGELQNGVVLSGLVASEPGLNQVGHWMGQHNNDYISFFDSTSVPGFRIQMSLSGDFIYSGTSTTQQNLPASNFITYAEWDETLNQGMAPMSGVDDSTFSLSIDTIASCKPSPTNPYSDYYFFNTAFLTPDFYIPFSIIPFNYVVSTNTCTNQGRINMGRFELDMGEPKSGEYKSSMFMIMLDGY